MRSVDELVVPDVDAHVAEPVEEDEVAGLEAAPRDGDAHLILRHGVVRERDPELRVHVHHEP